MEVTRRTDLTNSSEARNTKLLLAIQHRLEAIEEKLEKRISRFATEEAVAAYWEHHLSRTKNPRSYEYLMRQFQASFSGRNIPDITPVEVEAFLSEIAQTPNTRAQRAIQLKGFFNWCNKHLLKKGGQTFPNPLNVLEFVKYRKEPDYIATETIEAMLKESENMRERLVVMILASTGMRPGELANLRHDDIDGQVITIRNPKSHRYNSPLAEYTEKAVMPERVWQTLRLFLQENKHERKLLGSYKYIYSLVRRLSGKVGTDLSPHDLRRWCATFWERQGEWAMVNFVLRHKTRRHKAIDDPLAMQHYIAPLTLQEAIAKQTLMNDIFKL
jgi:integrase